MKKVICVSLILSMLFALTGCIPQQIALPITEDQIEQMGNDAINNIGSQIDSINQLIDDVEVQIADVGEQVNSITGEVADGVAKVVEAQQQVKADRAAREAAAK